MDILQDLRINQDYVAQLEQEAAPRRRRKFRFSKEGVRHLTALLGKYIYSILRHSYLFKNKIDMKHIIRFFFQKRSYFLLRVREDPSVQLTLFVLD